MSSTASTLVRPEGREVLAAELREVRGDFCCCSVAAVDDVRRPPEEAEGDDANVLDALLEEPGVETLERGARIVDRDAVRELRLVDVEDDVAICLGVRLAVEVLSRSLHLSWT